MSIKITSVSKALENNGLKILIHGQAGSGKTVFCATSGASTLIISAESGLLSIAEAPDYIQTTVVNTIFELEQVYEYLEDNIEKFDWVCLDSISEIAEVLLADEKKNSKDPRQAYGNLSDRMLSIMRGFRDLKNINVVFTCKQQRQLDPDTNITRFIPMLPGQALTNNIGYLFDEVFVLRVEKDDEGEDYRTVQTGRDRNYEAKDRSGVLEMFEKPNLKYISEKINIGYTENSDEEKEIEEVEEIEHIEEKSESSDDDVSESAESKEKEIEEKLESEKSESNPEEKESSDQSEDGIEKDDDNLIINDTDKTMYLYHSTSDGILKLPVGDELVNDGNVDIITFKEFLDHKKRLSE